MYDAKILADSVSPVGIRLTTIQVTFPRFILAEMNTHRVFSRNSASSRAIPPEKQIHRVLNEPFIPEVFRARVKGMGQGEELEDQDAARAIWIRASEDAAGYASELADMGISKAITNRPLEPFLWHTAIISATEWDNFYALRCPPGDEVDYNFPAQPEFQQVAILMRQAMRNSDPKKLAGADWHLPMITDFEMGERWPMEKLAMISAGRCARVSFDTQDRYEHPEDSIRRADGLLTNGHMSPFEHQAMPGIHAQFYGNFRGWVQFRKTIDHEANRVGHLTGREDWTQD